MKHDDYSQLDFITLLIALAALIISISSCTPSEDITPTPICHHTLEWNDTDQRLHVDIVSDLDHVTITRTAQGFDPLTFRITRDYFTCTKLPLFDAETVVTITGEETCQYVF